MNFRPDLAEKVLRGEKITTRRLASDNPRSPWWREKCGLRVGSNYAVCPGRGKPAIGRVRVIQTLLARLGMLSDAEARREGFADFEAFRQAWIEINGGYDTRALVWRVDFALVGAQGIVRAGPSYRHHFAVPHPGPLPPPPGLTPSTSPPSPFPLTEPVPQESI